jgi:serine phosphatase RsbU (regulator of sigma subunit)
LIAQTFLNLKFLLLSWLAQIQLEALPDIAAGRAQLREEIAKIVIGGLLFALGFAAFSLLALRWKSRDRSRLFFGTFCWMYGIRILGETELIRFLINAPTTFWSYLQVYLTYVIPLIALLTAEHFLGAGWKSSLRRTRQIQTVYSVSAILIDSVRGPRTAIGPNNYLVILMILVLAANVFYLIFREKLWAKLEVRVASAGALFFFLFILNENLVTAGLVSWQVHMESLGLLVFLSCLGYVIAHRFFANEKRLLNLTFELETAREIQTSILPRQIPQIEGFNIATRYIPMTAVGGDFYEFLVIDEKRLAVIVVDVSGHGVPAALVASMVKIAISSQATHASDPATALYELNQIFCGKLERAYVTAIHIFLDREKRILLYANAGHPPLLLWRRAEGKIQELTDNGLPLGLFSFASYVSTEVKLHPGDRVLLYTDGVTEAMNSSGNLFGIDRFKDFIEAQSETTADPFSDRLLEQISIWSGKNSGDSLDDDVTLVVVDVEN